MGLVALRSLILRYPPCSTEKNAKTHAWLRHKRGEFVSKRAVFRLIDNIAVIDAVPGGGMVAYPLSRARLHLTEAVEELTGRKGLNVRCY